MPPNIHFEHSNILYNPCLAPQGPLPLKVGQRTLISISLYNSGDPTATVDVRLWWIGPNASSAPRMDLVYKLDPPGPTPVLFNVASGSPGTGQVTVAWTPSPADLPRSLGSFLSGKLFAQAVVQPIPPTYPGDKSALNIWTPTYTLCAQHNVTIAT